MRRGRPAGVAAAVVAVAAGVLVAPGAAAGRAAELANEPVIVVHAPDGAWEGWYRRPVNIQAEVKTTFPLVYAQWSRKQPSGEVLEGNLDPRGTGFAVSTPGVTEFTFRASDLGGVPVEAKYGVGIDPSAPDISFGTMPADIVVGLNAEVPFGYSCTDSFTRVKSCAAPTAAGTLLPSSTYGEHQSTVRAEDMVGNVGTRTLTYTVVDPMRLAEAPRIAGTARAGSTLSVEGGVFNPAAEERDIRWYRDQTQVATGDAYTLTDADVGFQMWVSVAGKRRYFAPYTASSAKTAQVQKRLFESTGTLRVRGDAVIGRVLELDQPQVTPAPTGITYQWYRNGGVIQGANKATYTVTAADTGTTLSAGVEYTRADREPLRPFSAATEQVLAPLALTRAPAIRGTAVIGGTLSSTPPQYEGPVDRLNYSWLRDGAPIPGASSAQYRLAAADIGRRITLRVVAQSARRPDALSQSASTAKVLRAAAAVKAKAVARGKKRVRITAQVAAYKVVATGKVTVYRGTKVVGRGTVGRSGKVTINLTRQPKSKVTYKVVYSGSSLVAPKTVKTARIRVR